MRHRNAVRFRHGPSCLVAAWLNQRRSRPWLLGLGLYFLFETAILDVAAAHGRAGPYWKELIMDRRCYLGQWFRALPLSPNNLITALAGTTIGTIVGLLPGLGPINGGCAV